MGELDDELSHEYPIWRLVTEKGLSLEEVDSWDWEEIDKANAILDMAQDYQTAYRLMYDARSAREAKKA